jgi:hypothetical protein
VDPRADLDDLEKRKSLILPGFELRPLGFHTVHVLKAFQVLLVIHSDVDKKWRLATSLQWSHVLYVVT